MYQAQVGQQTTFLTNDAIWLTVLEEKSISTAEEVLKTLRVGMLSEDFTSTRGPNYKGRNLKLTFVGANPGMTMKGFSPLDRKVSYLGENSGGGASKSDVPVWGGIRYQNIYQGFDLEMAGENGNFSWQFVKTSHADNSKIAIKEFRVKIEGTQTLAIQGENVCNFNRTGKYI